MKGRALDLLAGSLLQLGFDIDQACLNKFQLFAEELSKWNRKINLTSIKQPEEIVIKHFIDSLTVAGVAGKSGRLLDIGSGAGFPCIPLKIVSPDLKIVSIDSVEKKIVFQRAVARLLQLKEFTAIHTRVESISGESSGGFDKIVSRAFADLATYTRIALPLLAPDGIIIAMKGGGGIKEAKESGEALKILGARIERIDEFCLPVSGDKRVIITLKKEEK